MNLSMLAFCVLAAIFAGYLVLTWFERRAWAAERERLYDRIQGPEYAQWMNSVWKQKADRKKAEKTDEPERHEIPLDSVGV